MVRRSRAIGVRARTAIAVLAAFGSLIGSAVALSAPAVADTAPASGTPATVSADPLPTVQEDGVVWAQVTVGNIVYATGSFSQTWPAGQTASSANETPRANLLAYDITTGNLVTGFDHSLNAQGLGIAASPDGRTVYVVGDFTTVDGIAHNHIAAFDTNTGALDTGFAAGVSGQAAAVTASASAVYVGGNFFGANGVARTRLAAFVPSTGALLSWKPTADDGQVAALAITPDGSRVIVGGRFSTIDGQAASGMGSVDATSGSTLEPWSINTIAHDGSPKGKCGITNLSVDGNAVYGGGFAFGCGNLEGTFAADPDTGNVIWINDCHGDTYSTQPIGSVLYVASHAHDCRSIDSFPNGSPPGVSQRATAFTTYATGVDTYQDPRGLSYVGQPYGSLLHWFPTLTPGTVTGQNQAAWTVTGNTDYVAYGGEFPTVNGTAQHGLVRFAVTSLAPNAVGPESATSGTTLVPTVSSTSYGQVDLSWKATWDRDNTNLTYRILRDGTAVGTVSQASSFWVLPTLTYTDSGLTPGTSHTYRIQVSDPLGNSIGSGTSQAVTVSSAGGPPPNAAPTAAFTSSCSLLTCRFDAGSSTDSDGTIVSYAWDYGDGTTGTGVTSTHTYALGGPHTVTLTVTDNGGATGNVLHTVSTNAPPTAAFTSSCTLLACRFDAGTSTDSDGTIASYDWDYGDNTSGTGVAPTHTFATGGPQSVTLTVTDDGGAVDSVTHSVSTNAPPTAAFTGSCTNLTCKLDASGSSDSDGTVSAYAWDFGDGTTGTGVTPSHTYASAGSYPVTLTVTDNGGATSNPVSHTVTAAVAPAPVWASDAFNRTVKSGWGKARIGGAWSHSGCASMSVSSGHGTLVDRRGKSCAVWLPAVHRSSTDTSVTMLAPSVPKGGLQVAVIGRRISGADDIRVQLDLKHDGRVVATLVRRVGSKATALSKGVTISPPAHSSGQVHVELLVFGTSPTLVRAKVWLGGTAKPSAWTVQGSTTASALQHHGSVGMATVLHKANNPKTATLRVSDFVSRAVLG